MRRRELAAVGRFFAAGLLACLAAWWPAPVVAAGLQVTPVLLEFDATQRALAVWLGNTASHPIRAQVRLRAWRQVNGGDVLEPTAELVASPPLVEIPAGQTQLVRIVRRAGHQPASEAAYRLLVDELPSPDTGERSPGGIHFLFRYLIPVFVAPPSGPAPAEPVHGLSARLTPADGQQARLTIRNAGPWRAKLSDLSHLDAHGERVVLGSGLFGYVLAGAERQWSLPWPAQPQGMKGALQARVNEDRHETVLVQDLGGH